VLVLQSFAPCLVAAFSALEIHRVIPWLSLVVDVPLHCFLPPPHLSVMSAVCQLQTFSLARLAIVVTAFSPFSFLHASGLVMMSLM
jgi:hypothetical protein